MADIASWLTQHGLGKYASVFANNDIELDIIAEITEQDLESFGFSFGDRKRFMRAVREGIEPDDTRAAPSDMLPTAASVPIVREAERRQLTVMFCDLVGSTALSARLDPEDYRTVLSRFQAAVTEAITDNGGFIARYMGDGVLTYFGYPAASENDPEQAVRAGLAIVEAVSGLDIEPRLQVRIGIATGPVVVGDIIGEGVSEEAAVLGETPNLAARLQSVAQPNTVLVAASTRALLGERLEFLTVPRLRLKGIAAPVEAFRAIRSRSTAEVNETQRDDYPLVGREVELALLERASGARLLRAEAILCAGAAWTFAHRDELSQSLDYAQRGARAARAVGSELWRVYCRAAEARTLILMGRASEGRVIAQECVESARSGGSAIVGGICFGALALSVDGTEELDDVLTEGQAQLGGGDAAHCHLDFYRDAIDACLQHQRWDAARQFALALRDFIAMEPLAPAELLASRGEVLADVGQGNVTPATRLRLEQLCQTSDALGLYYFSQRLRTAHAELPST